MSTRVILLGILGVVALSGCTHEQMEKYSLFGQASANPDSIEHVQMRMDEGDITPLPQHYNMSNSSVDVFNNVGNVPDYHGQAPIMQPSIPNYGGGMPSMADSSVTIFSLDSSAPMMGGDQIAGGFDNYSAMPMDQGFVAYGGEGNQIFFKDGSSRLGSGDLRKLSNVAERAKFAPVNRVTVAGYASRPTQAGSNTVQGHILNLKESMNRSFAVSKELIKKGVPAEKIKAVAWGATKPTGNEEQDRRVDVIMGEQ